MANAPATWDELKTAALAAAGSGVEGVLFNGGRWEGTTFAWLAHFWSQGGDLVDDAGKPIFGEGEQREKMLKAINFYKDLVDSGAAPKRVATITDYNDFNAAALARTAAGGLSRPHRRVRRSTPAVELRFVDSSAGNPHEQQAGAFLASEIKSPQNQSSESVTCASRSEWFLPIASMSDPV